MDKCPYCGAETRPGDNFCLNCGNRLPAAGSVAQMAGDATLPADENWVPPTAPASLNGQEIPPTQVSTAVAESAPAPAIASPARLTLRTEGGEVLQEMTLDKLEYAIGRAPSSDILLSKDKLTSRRHATIHYENGAYFLMDERSANGTFVNGQQLEEKVPRKLQNGDHISIGEYELIFHASQGDVTDIENMPTMMVSPGTETYATSAQGQPTAPAANDDFGTRPWEESGEMSKVESSAPAVALMDTAAPSTPQPPVEAPAPSTAATSASPAPEMVAPTPLEAGGVTFGRLTSLPQPQMPDVAPLMAALATLDGQVTSLQDQLRATEEAMRNHEAEIAQTANQLRAGVRRVSERMDNTIADVARSREQLAWAELIQLMEDVMNNPRDIEYVTKLARKARELNKVFQIHQNVLNTLAECTSLLRGLIGEDRL
ncbi:MAG TPA: FHA domain-containing protein [Ktedonobacteraceae bacterium]|jgi:pSer/pThr/pTyr-binding forkhead associated (FHA) protein|nr:FHA domain-containing protein [Ktedonobacteraceae bacterium]